MKVKLLIILLLLVFIGKIEAQDYPKEPKVGLVLSGGGAKGFAHIGALKVIDSLGIKVDYIAGTSMGAIVGSLYASGYSGKELDSIFKNANFEEIINDKLPREAKTFYEKDQSEKYAVSIPFDNFEIQVPRSLSRGQNVFNLLTKVLLHVNDVKDFSKLPIPFFCIATNIETGEEVILDSGNLPKAVSASGAFPSLFQPVIIDGKVLIDGGVVNNYPIDKLKEKGMDIIIGVDVQDGLRDREALQSATDVLLQVNNFRTINDMKEKSKITDIYIKPDITEYTVISFGDVNEIIENGRLGAIEKAEALKALANKQITPPIERPKIQSVDSIKLNAFTIKGNENYTYSYITGKLKLKKGETMDYYDFNKGINNLMATNNFERFDYTLEPLGDGYELTAEVEETQNKTFLKLGVHYDDLYKSAALINLTRKHVLFNNDVATFDFIVGDNVRYNFEYYIDKGFHWSVGLTSRYNHFDKNINASTILSDEQLLSTPVNKVDTELSDITNRFFLQTLLQKDLLLTLGAEHKRLKISTETILDDDAEEGETIFEKSDFLSVFGQLKLDSFTDKYFPKRGFFVDCDFHLYLSSSDFNNTFSQFSIAKGDFAFAFKLANKLHTTIGTQGGFKIGNDDTQSLDFVLGGYGNNLINNFIPFYGYDFLSLPGNSFVKAYTNIDFEIFKKHHLIASVNLANIDRDIFETGEWITTPDYTGYALGYSIETFLGPLEAKWTFSGETKQSIWFFNLGFWF
ncbi:patatin-like phospholipase family protein [Winogradskyella sp. 3972H.M.0a.05]|uniref:patatin-like phospholipase family protein n=1 Tax=Winogradskyella sp. 3972H.M.0a.05 TaxID=2950277 RepID=UPI003399B7A3